MTELHLVTTDDRAKVLGTIRITGGRATFTGRSAETIFRNTQKQRRTENSDQAIFDLLAKGWSNGPLKLVTGQAAPTQDG